MSSHPHQSGDDRLDRAPAARTVRCRVCGSEFDPHAFQIVIPGRAESFDRVECALQAYALAPPEGEETDGEAAVERSLLRPARLRPVV